METRAGYIAVGAFVIAVTAAAFGFVLWLTGTDGGRRPVVYAIYFDGSVTGLQDGGVVRYRGVPVGTVTDIRIDPDNIERIRVLASLSADTPVKTDTIATLALQGVTGLAYVELTGGTQESPRIERADGARYPVIRSKTSGLQQIMEQIPAITERIVTVTERLAALLDDDNVNAITATLKNLQTLSRIVADRSVDLDRMITDGRVAISAFREASESVGGLASDVAKRVDPIARDAEKIMSRTRVAADEAALAATSFRKISNELTSLIAENRRPISDFSSSGLYEFSQFIAEARVLVDTLNRLSTQIERDPARFFFGDTQKGFEAQ